MYMQKMQRVLKINLNEHGIYNKQLPKATIEVIGCTVCLTWTVDWDKTIKMLKSRVRWCYKYRA